MIVPSAWFTTHTWVPSEETDVGSWPTATVCSTAEVASLTSLTVLSVLLVSHTDASSVATAEGHEPAGMVWL